MKKLKDISLRGTVGQREGRTMAEKEVGGEATAKAEKGEVEHKRSRRGREARIGKDEP